MLFTVFIVPVTLRTESELHPGTIRIRPAADRAFMFGDPRILSQIPLEFLPSANLFRIQTDLTPRRDKEHNEIEQ